MHKDQEEPQGIPQTVSISLLCYTYVEDGILTIALCCNVLLAPIAQASKNPFRFEKSCSLKLAIGSFVLSP